VVTGEILLKGFAGSAFAKGSYPCVQ
jgi:hypothetical protein